MDFYRFLNLHKEVKHATTKAICDRCDGCHEYNLYKCKGTIQNGFVGNGTLHTCIPLPGCPRTLLHSDQQEFLAVGAAFAYQTSAPSTHRRLRGNCWTHSWMSEQQVVVPAEAQGSNAKARSRVRRPMLCP